MRKLKRFIAAPLAFAGLIVLAYFANLITPIEFNHWGIRPRSIEGLVGIPLVVFLHGNLNHLLSNIVPIFILGLLLRSYGKHYFVNVTIALTLLSGLLTWALSPSDLLVGASGLVFAYFSYLIAKAIRNKTPLTILIALVVILTYGYLFFSLASIQQGVSWTGHVCGFASGILLALYGPKRLR